MRKFFLRDRKKKIIAGKKCEDKHVFDKKDIMKTVMTFNMSKKITCLRCGNEITLNEMIASVATEQGIDLNDKGSLFKSFKNIAKDDKEKKENA